MKDSSLPLPRSTRQENIQQTFHKQRNTHTVPEQLFSQQTIGKKTWVKTKP
jgi:hypothetical protein